jgi:FimV-like protein
MRKIVFIFLLFLLSAYSFASNNTTYGPTTSSDQLWQIAIFVRPNAAVSIAKTMQALQKKNPDAFIGNKLKAGVILQVPLLAEIQAIGPQKQRSLDSRLRENDSIKMLLLKFDQQYQDRIADIEQHNLSVQKQLIALTQQIGVLHDQINKLKEPSKNELFYVKLRDSFGGYGLYVITGIVVILLLLLLLVCACAKTKKSEVETNEDTESEYDFMGSSEGIPAKLDLARAYIDMDDKESARKILTEVSKKGDKKQQQEAQELLARIK